MTQEIQDQKKNIHRFFLISVKININKVYKSTVIIFIIFHINYFDNMMKIKYLMIICEKLF